MKFKEGDKVRIIDNTYGHEFEMGTIVRIVSVGTEDYHATNGKVEWYIKDEEIEAVDFECNVGNVVEDASETTLKFKKGDKVRIVDNICEHDFEIGTIVEILGFGNDNDYRATDYSDAWFVIDDEIEAISIKCNVGDVMKKVTVDEVMKKSVWPQTF